MSGATSHWLPRLITFTGADDNTDVEQMEDLSLSYPVEFGILFSPKRTGHGRYPSESWVTKLIDFENSRGLLNLSAHICGAHSRELLNTRKLPSLAPIFESGAFQRAQVNTADAKVFDSANSLFQWGYRLHVDVILQTRDAQRFPPKMSVNWLFDQSGGRGTLPAAWPSAPQDEYVGFAGGLNPDNVAQSVRQIGAQQQHYWIDMESGVRDENDRFSITKCRQVCEAVFGPVEGGAA